MTQNQQNQSMQGQKKEKQYCHACGQEISGKEQGQGHGNQEKGQNQGNHGHDGKDKQR